MGFLENGNSATDGQTPWTVGPDALFAELKDLLHPQVAALALVDPRAPGPDAFLLVRGLDASAVTAWCEAGHKQDDLFQRARRRTAAAEQLNGRAGSSLLPAGLEAMVQLVPASRTSGRSWYLALARPEEPFDEQAQHLASLLLRALQAAFDYPAEPGLGRVLLGADHELVHADPRTEARFLRQPEVLDQLREQLPAVVSQRWPELDDERLHDIALDLAGQGTWIRFRRAAALTGAGIAAVAAHHWYLELRPLGKDDVPPLGALDDDRVARAVAYLSDHYRSSPTLGDVAEAVQTSPFHFHRLFVKHAGISPKHYLLRIQLMIAKWLLRATRTPIGEIASATGFASHGHFTATFHRLVGVSPSTFREQA
ncbi:MAG: helix-turn-helix domain-containing protein [Phycisphaeraceae bacterium]